MAVRPSCGVGGGRRYKNRDAKRRRFLFMIYELLNCKSLKPVYGWW
jgi:hypothetical protein